jgi:hypothetical protein
MPSVLFVFSSATPQGWYLPEAAHPYYVLAPHANIDFTSPNGTPLSMTAVSRYHTRVQFDPKETKLSLDKQMYEKDPSQSSSSWTRPSKPS